MSALEDLPICEDLIEFNDAYCKDDCDACEVADQCTSLLIEALCEALTNLTVPFLERMS